MSRYRRQGSLYIPDQEIVGPGVRGFRAVPGLGRGRAGIATHTQAPPAAPDITSISPITGSDAGGTPLTINGHGFVSGATVLVGGASATSVVFVGTTQLTCLTPAGTAGARDVKVTNPDTQFGTLSSGFTYTAAGSFQTPDILDHWSFEGVSPTAWGGYTNGGGAVPSGVALDTVAAGGHVYAGSQSVKRAIIATGFNVVSISNASPPVLTLGLDGGGNHSSYSTGKHIGVNGTSVAALNSPFGSANRYLKALSADTYEIYSDAACTVPLAAPGSVVTNGNVDTGDAGGSMYKTFAATNDLYRCIRFYPTVSIDGILKFLLYFDQNAQLGGMYMMSGQLRWLFIDWLNLGIGNSSLPVIGNLASILNQWNSMEIHYIRIGHASTSPAAGFWLNGVQVVPTLSAALLAVGASIDGNGYVVCGSRVNGTGNPYPTATQKISYCYNVGILNGQPINTNSGHIWLDDDSYSTAGRIGP